MDCEFYFLSTTALRFSRLVVWVLWHIKLYRLFNAKSILYKVFLEYQPQEYTSNIGILNSHQQQ